MGVIADLVNNKALYSSPLSPRSSTQSGRGRWREIFGATNKEQGGEGEQRVIPGGTHSRSNVSGTNSVKRLLEGLRSRAPGGWVDNRWEQGGPRHFVEIAYIAIHRIATQWMQSEFQVYKRDRNHPDGKRPITEDDKPENGRFVKPYQLVHTLQKPNKQDSFGKYLYRLCQQKYLTGTALTWMVPNKLGVPLELYCIPTALAIPMPISDPDYPDGYYRIQPITPYGPFSSYSNAVTSAGASIPAEWMLRFQYPHPLFRYEGHSPLTAMRLTLDVFESICRSRWYMMKRAPNPSAMLDLSAMDGAEPWVEAELERIRADFEMELQGPENAGKLFIPPPGGKLEPWGQRPVDMDYPSGFEQLTSMALAGFGITKPVAGMVEDSSYATLFAALKQFHVLTIGPDMIDLGNELTRHLAPFFGDDLIVEINCPRIDDHELKQQKLTLLGNFRAVTKNELRKECDMPLTTEKWGNDVAGDPSPMMQQAEAGPEQGGGGLEQALSMGGGEGSGAPTGQEVLAQGGSLQNGAANPAEEREVGTTQPKPRLGKSMKYKSKSLNPDQKNLYEKILEECSVDRPVLRNGRKSLYDAIRRACENDD